MGSEAQTMQDDPLIDVHDLFVFLAFSYRFISAILQCLFLPESVQLLGSSTTSSPQWTLNYDHFSTGSSVSAIEVTVRGISLQRPVVPGQICPDCFTNACVDSIIRNEVKGKVQCLEKSQNKYVIRIFIVCCINKYDKNLLSFKIIVYRQ